VLSGGGYHRPEGSGLERTLLDADESDASEGVAEVPREGRRE